MLVGYWESELMVVVTPQKMKNPPRWASDTLLLATLDIGNTNTNMNKNTNMNTNTNINTNMNTNTNTI